MLSVHHIEGLELDQEAHDCFAFLGVFAPKPATFDLEDLAEVWGIEDAEPIAQTLRQHGLLEATTNGRFCILPEFAEYARSLLT